MSLHCVFSKLYFTELWKTKYIVISLPFVCLASASLTLPLCFSAIYICLLSLFSFGPHSYIQPFFENPSSQILL